MERISNKELPEGLYKALLAGQQYVNNSGLDHSLIKLIQMRVSQINSCAYCIDMHFKEGIQAGETPLRLISVSAWRETTYYTPKEQAVLEFAERLTRMREEEHSDNIHDNLSEYFSKQEIANITMAVIQINSWNRLTRSFGTVAGNHKVATAVAAL
jgi:AhpD family alkylhydroperoxidase